MPVYFYEDIPDTDLWRLAEIVGEAWLNPQRVPFPRFMLGRTNDSGIVVVPSLWYFHGVQDRKPSIVRHLIVDPRLSDDLLGGYRYAYCSVPDWQMSRPLPVHTKSSEKWRAIPWAMYAMAKTQP